MEERCEFFVPSTSMLPETLYHPSFVSDLFDRMSPSYTVMNHITSLGFYPLWRRRAVAKLHLDRGDTVADLLAGPGDSWKFLLPKIGKEGKVTALDFSQGMIDQAIKRRAQYKGYSIDILNKDIFNSGIPDNSQDAVICCYGLKTFSPRQLEDFVKELLRILKPGGRYSLVEVATPENKILRKGYQVYLKYAIPFISKQCVPNPDTYNYLELYSYRFGGFDLVEKKLKEYGGNPKMEDLTWGCAKMIWGFKS